MKLIKKAISFIVVVLICSLVLGVNSYAADEVINLKYAGGADGSGTYRSGLAIASIVNKYSKRIKIFVQITPGTAVTPKMIQAGQVDMAAGSQSGETESIKGLGIYKGKPVTNMSRLFVWGMSSYVIFSPAEKNIFTIRDLVGKRVGIGAKTQPTGQTCETVLKALGIADKVKYSFNTSAEEIGDRIKDGLYDAGFYGVAMPWGVLSDLVQTRKMRIVGIEGEDLDKAVAAVTPRYGKVKMPANVYPDQKAFPTLGALQTTCVRSDLDEGVAYEIIKIIETHFDEFVMAYPPAKFYFKDMDNQAMAIAPLHPGTKRWLKEKGIKVQ